MLLILTPYFIVLSQQVASLQNFILKFDKQMLNFGYGYLELDVIA